MADNPLKARRTQSEGSRGRRSSVAGVGRAVPASLCVRHGLFARLDLPTEDREVEIEFPYGPLPDWLGKS